MGAKETTDHGFHRSRSCAERLRELGHELRRPEADYLREGIYELRAKYQRVNYRILYFFAGRQAVVVTHGILKQVAAVPAKEIDLAIRRR